MDGTPKTPSPPVTITRVPQGATVPLPSERGCISTIRKTPLLLKSPCSFNLKLGVFTESGRVGKPDRISPHRVLSWSSRSCPPARPAGPGSTIDGEANIAVISMTTWVTRLTAELCLHGHPARQGRASCIWERINPGRNQGSNFGANPVFRVSPVALILAPWSLRAVYCGIRAHWQVRGKRKQKPSRHCAMDTEVLLRRGYPTRA